MVTRSGSETIYDLACFDIKAPSRAYCFFSNFSVNVKSTLSPSMGVERLKTCFSGGTQKKPKKPQKPSEFQNFAIFSIFRGAWGGAQAFTPLRFTKTSADHDEVNPSSFSSIFSKHSLHFFLHFFFIFCQHAKQTGASLCVPRSTLKIHNF